MSYRELSTEERSKIFGLNKDNLENKSLEELLARYKQEDKTLPWPIKYFIVALLAISIIGLIYLAFCIKLVAKGKIGISINSGKSVPLLPGWHLLLSPFHSFETQIDADQEILQLESGISILTIPNGKVAIVQDKSEYKLLPSGRYLLDNGEGTKKWIATKNLESQDREQREISLGNRKYIRVLPGEVGIVYDNSSSKADSTIKILSDCSLYVIDGNELQFGGFFSTTQQIINIELNEINTLNNLSISISGDICYRISQENVAKAITEVGGAYSQQFAKTKLKELIKEHCRIALSEVISKHNHDGSTTYEEQGLIGKGSDDYATNFEKLFEENLKKELDNIGVTFVRFGRTRFNINDEKVKHEMAEQTARQTRSIAQRTTAQKDAETKKIIASGEKDKTITEAHAYAEAQRIKAQADANYIRITGDAKIETAKKWQKANPEAYKLLIQAEALANTKAVIIPAGGNSSFLPMFNIDSVTGETVSTTTKTKQSTTSALNLRRSM